MTIIPSNAQYDFVDKVGAFMRKVDTAFKSSDEPPEELPNPDVNPEVNTIFSDDDPNLTDPLNMSTDVGTIWVETDTPVPHTIRWWDGFGWQPYIGDDWHGYFGLDAWGPAMVVRGVISGIRVYLVNSAPASPQPFWIYKLISSGDTFYRNPANTAWVQITDQNILDAVESALITPPVDLTDTYLHAIWQAIAPTGKNSTSDRGDLWFESDRDFIAWVWDGTDWITFTGLPPEEPDTPGDGNPPGSSPTPSVLAGFGSYFITWDAIDNADPVEYDVYMSKINPVVGSPVNFLGTVLGTFAYCGAEPDGTPLDDLATYYFAVQARDVDGLAPLGTTVSGGLVRQKITSTQINDDSILTPMLVSNLILAEHLFTNSVYTGALQSDSVTTIKVLAQNITGTKISGDAIDGKVVTGATLRTAASGERLILRNDGGGGILESFSGLSGESPGWFNPSLISGFGSRPALSIRAGSTPSFPMFPEIQMISGATSGSNRSQITLFPALHTSQSQNSDAHLTMGADSSTGFSYLSIAADQMDFFNFTGSAQFYGSLHGKEVYSDNQSGSGFVNAQLSGEGRIVRGSSTERVKDNIQDLPLEVAKRVLDLRAITFTRLDDPDDIVYPGALAEQAESVGLNDWVVYDSNGRVADLRYAELTVALSMLVRDLYERIEELETRL